MSAKRFLLRALAATPLAAVLAACAPPSGAPTEAPGSADGTTPPPPGATPGPAAAPGGQPAAPTPAAKDLDKDTGKKGPRVTDRDPEEEKRKMSLSRARSAEARKMLGARRFDEAVLHAREALKISELNTDAMLVLAEVFYRQGKYELTQTTAASVLGVDPKVVPAREMSMAHNLRAFALIEMGRPEAATQAFRKAAEADANNAAAWNNLGTRYLTGGDVKTAIDVFQYALSLDPKFLDAQLNLGAALRASRRWQEAEAAFQKVLAATPMRPEVHFDLGLLYLDADPFPGLDTIARLNKAIASLTRYRELAVAAGPSGPPRRPPAVGLGKQAPEPVGIDRADEYIAVAKKGIDREERRVKREQERAAKGGGPGGPGGAVAPKEPSAPQAPPPAAPPPSPAPSPGAAPTTAPIPQGPTSPPPTATAPQSPSPQAPAPQAPAPQAPAPQAPAPQAPAPQAPKNSATPSAPGSPTPGPAPQKPKGIARLDLGVLTSGPNDSGGMRTLRGVECPAPWCSLLSGRPS